MGTTQLFIPDRINVGFQERHNTYTGRLAYVIYFDQRGCITKQTKHCNNQSKEICTIDNRPTHLKVSICSWCR